MGGFDQRGWANAGLEMRGCCQETTISSPGCLSTAREIPFASSRVPADWRCQNGCRWEQEKTLKGSDIHLRRSSIWVIFAAAAAAESFGFVVGYAVDVDAGDAMKDYADADAVEWWMRMLDLSQMHEMI